MSVIVKGMEMPTSCHECYLCCFGFCYVAPPEADGICPYEWRADWCPLIELPPHGDLIDREYMRKRIEGSGYAEQIKDNLFFMLAFAPTILEAERKEIN